MKLKNLKMAAVILAAAWATVPILRADDAKKPKDLKPYVLKTCIVSGEKFGGDMGEPVVYEYKGREIKFCCKDCRKDFDKEPAKYIKKIEAAEAKAKKQP